MEGAWQEEGRDRRGRNQRGRRHIGKRVGRETRYEVRDEIARWRLGKTMTKMKEEKPEMEQQQQQEQ
eukprot:762882-Hanusia_phi.AAC.1